ncbi:MAG: hypothetical protein WDM90_16780 [Ferruginibacter sp.]
MKRPGIGTMKISARKNARLLIPGGKQKLVAFLLAILQALHLQGQVGLHYRCRGVQPILVDERGEEITVKDEHGMLKGNLCIKAPWPAILRTTYGDHERCRTNYFATYPNLYFTGDGALKDENGFYRNYRKGLMMY